MCLNVFVGSQKKLPLIAWNKDDPKLYVRDAIVKHIPETARKQMASLYFYEIGSHMGCACGIGHGETWGEENEQRYRDSQLLYTYLSDAADNNQLELFCTWYEQSPDVYQVKPFNIEQLLGNEWDAEEDVILKLSIH